MRCVLDTNVALSGLLWNGSPSQLLSAAEQGAIELFSSAVLLEELCDVLSRPKCAKKLLGAGLSADLVLGLYSSAVSLVNPVPVPRLAPDPDDDVVIGTAIAANAELVVTGDRTLLAVGVFHGGRIVTVAEALKAISEAVPREDP